MGKKKIGEQDTNEALAEASKIESQVSAAAGQSVKKKTASGKVYVRSSYNNTIVTVTDEKGKVLFWSSAGSIGFTGPKKATPFAASKIVAALTEKMKKAGMSEIEIIVSGVGGGRDSSVRSFANQGFTIRAIKDVTPIPHNGPKPRKTRRV
ncbi:MAG: 30S ribosomal protein S11 [Candidatus Harrisonbacteria bacterium CG10_big_fil_rev_8_21_14_0_10_44_23]|uniref:Small ribosomal subunit protein uS11 n=1 Tax=Candidatus Harrisonbacteria bacterium CG10_big_fil_rev_8_21_14_0_10_44_23 TaxID=1974585 RepID=A0A2H0UQB8_9BACT|nr:MAG: 30S ribosomal protein S11 [Candidatus Harrisonbacteria bacterium CG10_big_fil_rev_8_21_14_0_10_44_23]